MFVSALISLHHLHRFRLLLYLILRRVFGYVFMTLFSELWLYLSIWHLVFYD